VSADFVAKIGLTTRLHTHPYYIQWLNNSGKAKVTHTARVHFSIGTYHDYADCDVIPMHESVFVTSTIVYSISIKLPRMTQENYFASIDTE
jgi:hypothetical protein